MSKLAVAVGVFYVFIGVSVAVAPDWFFSVVDWESRQGLYAAAGIRLVLGLVLILAAPTSKFPKVFRVLGGIALIAGLGLLFVPIEFWTEMWRWWAVGHAVLMRAVVAIGGTLFGAFMAYAALPERAAS